jgi:hypothetical protein
MEQDYKSLDYPIISSDLERDFSRRWMESTIKRYCWYGIPSKVLEECSKNFGKELERQLILTSSEHNHDEV